MSEVEVIGSAIVRFLSEHGHEKLSKRVASALRCSAASPALDLVALVNKSVQEVPNAVLAQPDVPAHQKTPTQGEISADSKEAKKKRKQDKVQQTSLDKVTPSKKAKTEPSVVPDVAARSKKTRSSAERGSEPCGSQVSTPNGAAAETPEKKPRKHSKKGVKDADHFTRIDPQKAEKLLTSLKDSRLKDQSYESKVGDTFAKRAAEELKRVKGKDFRREMQKKKRSSWKGVGQLDMGVNSIQFDSD